MKLLVTGGCGFIGSAFVRLALSRGSQVVNLDKLTYAGNPANVADVADDEGYRFVHADIADADAVAAAVAGRRRRSSTSPPRATWTARSTIPPSSSTPTWSAPPCCSRPPAPRASRASCRSPPTRSTARSRTAPSARPTRISPSSPYSASKAGGDLQVLAWHRTFGLDAVITRGSNTFGPRQYPEKLIPLFVTNALDGIDRCRSTATACRSATGSTWTTTARASGRRSTLGEAGEVYNVGGGNEEPNLEITRRILALTGRDASLIRHVADRLGHDRRYALDTTKLRGLGWAPRPHLRRGDRRHGGLVPRPPRLVGAHQERRVPALLRGPVRRALRAISRGGAPSRLSRT